MRNAIRLSPMASMAFLLAACGGGDGASRDFSIASPEFAIAAGEEGIYCYYTSIPLATTVGVKKWTSTMTAGIHDLTLFFADTGKPDGTIDQSCSGLGGNPTPTWVYSANAPGGELAMPAGVGMTVEADRKVLVQVHYLNGTDAGMQAHFEISAETHPRGEIYSPASAYIAINTVLNIPSSSTNYTVEQSCPVPAAAEFFNLSTRTRKYGVSTEVRNGGSVVFSSDDWENPGAAQWSTPPFLSFASNPLTFQCVYNNSSGSPVQAGESVQTDEECMAIGYMFPAATPRMCLNETLLP